MTATPTLDATGRGLAPPDARRRRRRRADAVAAARASAGSSPRSSACSAGRSAWRKLTDNSFFWHLRTGEYILDHGIPHHDVFSYTAPGTKWVAQSWLAEVTYGVLYRSVGGVRHPAVRRRRRCRHRRCSRTGSRCGSCATASWRAGSPSPRSPASTPCGRSGRCCSACSSCSCCCGSSRCPTASSAGTRWWSCPC